MIVNSQTPAPIPNFIDGGILTQQELDTITPSSLDITALQCKMENEGGRGFFGNPNDMNYFVKYSCLRVYKFLNGYNVFRSTTHASFNVLQFRVCLMGMPPMFCFVEFKNILLEQVNQEILHVQRTVENFQTNSPNNQTETMFGQNFNLFG